MLQITSNGTELFVRIDLVEGRSSTGKETRIWTRAELGGSEQAVRALAEKLQEDLEYIVQNIRRKAYEEGAKDRANRKPQCSTVLRCNAPQGGVWRPMRAIKKRKA